MRRAGLAALVIVATALFAHAPAGAADWVEVRLSVDIEGGLVSGEATAPDRGMLQLRVKRPPRDGAAEPLEGYIGPDGALLPIDSGWLPPLPDGAAGWRMEVSTPPGFLAAPFPGGTVETTADGGRTTFDLPAVAARAPLVVGRYRMRERIADGVALRTFFTEPNAGHADAFLDAAAEAIRALSGRIGPYPYPAFAVVETPLPVGLGYPGFTLVSGRILALPFMRGRSLWHEIAHVWWGNGVLVDYASGNWAEGFATFFADYALAEREGPEAAREMRYDWLLEYDALPPEDDAPLRQFVSKFHGAGQAVGYGKAAMVLHMLRNRIGEAAFAAGIARFWRENRFERAGWSDIQAAFQAETQQDIAPFFTRWLEAPGALPPDPADKDFELFRRLAAEERIATLRAAFAGGRFTVEALDHAPVTKEDVAAAFEALGDVGPGGVRVRVGSRAALEADGAPPAHGAAAIWATKEPEGRVGLAIAVEDEGQLRPLLARARHYGRWSWLSIGADGRPSSGRWTPGG